MRNCVFKNLEKENKLGIFLPKVSQSGGNLLRDRYLMCDTLVLRYHEVSQGITKTYYFKPLISLIKRICCFT